MLSTKTYTGEEQNKFSQEIAPSRDGTQDLLIIIPMLYWLS